MDIALARTFLEIAARGSFIAAAEKLHLTQTAISARVRVLEAELGRKLFVRNKAGARLTPAGERFLRDASALVQTWERARQRVALPAGRDEVANIGGELSLWRPLLTDWLAWMRQRHPSIALNAEVALQPQLIERVQDGALDMAVLYDPPSRPGLAIELLAEEKLVFVTTNKKRKPDIESYVHIDWGPAFAQNIAATYPHLAKAAIFVTLGPMALEHVLEMGGCGYFRSQIVAPLIAAKTLHRVPGAPEFSYSVHTVHAANADPDLLTRMRQGLHACVAPTANAGRSKQTTPIPA